MSSFGFSDSSMIDKLKYVGNYQLDKTLGEGTFGKVKLGTHLLTGERVAVKILEKDKIMDSAEKDRIHREIRIMKLLNNPFVVRLYEVIDTAKHLFLILEYAEGGELFDYIVAHERVKEVQARKFFRQLVAGIDYCHQRNVIHRDLKPENLLLDADLNIKVVDFGFSNLINPGHYLRTFCGSPAYAAPEMISGKEYVGPEVDLWSMGVILFALICGYLPFDNSNISKLYQQILKGEYYAPDFMSAESKDLIKRLLTIPPDRRATMEDVRKHPWLNQGYSGPPESNPPMFDAIDPEVIRELEVIGFDPEFAHKSLKEQERNQVTATYWLLIEKRLKEGKHVALPPPIQGLPSAKDIVNSGPASAPSKLKETSPKVNGTNGNDSDQESVKSGQSSSDKLPTIPGQRRGSVHNRSNSNLLPIVEEKGSSPLRKRAVMQSALQNPSAGGSNTIGALPSVGGGAGGASDVGAAAGKTTPVTRRRRHSIAMGIGGNNSPAFLDSPRKDDKGQPQQKQKILLPGSQGIMVTGKGGNGNSNGGGAGGGRGGGGTRGRRMSLDPKSMAALQKATEGGDGSARSSRSELREVKGFFSVSTTSAKSVRGITTEVRRVLQQHNINFRESGYSFECHSGNVRFELEICKLRNLGTMSGIRLKRVAGDTWAYKNLCNQIAGGLNL